MRALSQLQCAELNWQLRGEAGKRQVQVSTHRVIIAQVANAKIALQHNLGLGGAAVVTVYRKGF
jgi:sterol carrier protein 2